MNQCSGDPSPCTACVDRHDECHFMPELDARRSTTIKHPSHGGGRRSSIGPQTSSISIESSHGLERDPALLDALSPFQQAPEAAQAVFNPETLERTETKNIRPKSSAGLRIQPQPEPLDGYNSQGPISPLTAQTYESASSLPTPASLDECFSSATKYPSTLSSTHGRWIDTAPQNFGSADSNPYSKLVEASMQQQFIDALNLCNSDTKLEQLLSYGPVQMNSSFGWTMLDDINTQTNFYDPMYEFINSV
jgi:hypothetical protein